jgi:hypothetical protein
VLFKEHGLKCILSCQFHAGNVGGGLLSQKTQKFGIVFSQVLQLHLQGRLLQSMHAIQGFTIQKPIVALTVVS